VLCRVIERYVNTGDNLLKLVGSAPSATPRPPGALES